MVYTKRTPWTLIMGVIMVAYAYLVQSGALAGLIKYLGTARYTGEMLTLGYAFGGIAIAIGLWQLIAKNAEGHIDYYLSTIGGLTFIMLVAFIVKWGLDPQMGQWGRAARPMLGFNFASVMNLNYVVMGIIAGIVIVNVFKIPDWAENGVRLSRLGFKTGVTTHHKRLQRGLVVDERYQRVANYVKNMNKEIDMIALSCGCRHARELKREHVRIVQSANQSIALNMLYPYPTAGSRGAVKPAAASAAA